MSSANSTMNAAQRMVAPRERVAGETASLARSDGKDILIFKSAEGMGPIRPKGDGAPRVPLPPPPRVRDSALSASGPHQYPRLRVNAAAALCQRQGARGGCRLHRSPRRPPRDPEPGNKAAGRRQPPRPRVPANCYPRRYPGRFWGKRRREPHRCNPLASFILGGRGGEI